MKKLNLQAVIGFGGKLKGYAHTLHFIFWACIYSRHGGMCADLFSKDLRFGCSSLSLSVLVAFPYTDVYFLLLLDPRLSQELFRVDWYTIQTEDIYSIHWVRPSSLRIWRLDQWTFWKVTRTTFRASVSRTTVPCSRADRRLIWALSRKLSFGSSKRSPQSIASNSTKAPS